MPVESNNSFVSSVTGYKMVTLKTKETTNIFTYFIFRSHGCEVEWLDNDCARISCKLEAFGTDSQTGKKTWFNNALAYYLGYSNQWNDPKKTIFFGNGDPVPEKAMQTLKEVHKCLNFNAIPQL